MSRQAKIGIHYELYRYWNAKRGGRSMPRRGDIDPSDLRTLLAHVMLIDRPAESYRYRLVGTAVAEELGHDLTRQMVGSYVKDPDYARAIREIYEHVFTTGRAVFTTGEYRGKSGMIHAVSRLLLPLGEDGAGVSMVLLTRVARFGTNFVAAAGWLTGVRGTVESLVDVESPAALESFGAAWERQVALARGGGLPRPAVR